MGDIRRVTDRFAALMRWASALLQRRVDCGRGPLAGRSAARRFMTRRVGTACSEDECDSYHGGHFSCSCHGLSSQLYSDCFRLRCAMDEVNLGHGGNHNEGVT
jgi:hypothetical protein